MSITQRTSFDIIRQKQSKRGQYPDATYTWTSIRRKIGPSNPNAKYARFDSHIDPAGISSDPCTGRDDFRTTNDPSANPATVTATSESKAPTTRNDQHRFLKAASTISTHHKHLSEAAGKFLDIFRTPRNDPQARPQPLRSRLQILRHP
jgi:hypothetical protein